MPRVEVKPELIRWATARSRRDSRSLERRFPRLRQWAQGETWPTFKQLESLAKATSTPIGYFFLSEPPVEQVPIPDFRTIGNVHLNNPSPNLLEIVHVCQQRQDWYREFARTNGDQPLPLVGSATVSDDVVATAAAVRRTLGFDLDLQRRASTWEEALRRFIGLADAAGVLVMCSGVVLNNNYRKLDPQEFRGFAIADPVAPLVFINGADTKAAQMFTLAHELAHIWLGQSALSDSDASRIPDRDAERWSNRVAAEVLVPLELVRGEFRHGAPVQVEMARLARRFKVSTLVVLRRIHDAGGISRTELADAYDSELRRIRALPGGGGGNFYLTQAARVSRRFARAAVVSALEGRSSFTESFRLLGVRKLATFRELGRSLGVPA